MITVPGSPVPIAILSTGDGWLAAEKPPSLSVHNDPGKDLRSILANYIEATPSFRDQLFYDPQFGLHAVHRLDKESSGVILLACRPEVFRHYSRQFETRQVAKRYVALLHGTLGPSNDTDAWGVWDIPLSADAGGRLNPAGARNIIPSSTRFRILRHSAHYTLIECEPLTGRTHQIRRHAKLASHPVVGDHRYGSQRSLKYLREQCGFDRLALHCLSITVQPLGRTRPETIKSLGVPVEILMLIDQNS